MSVHESIKKKFNIKRNGAAHEIRCPHKGCKQGWSWPADKEMTPGTILHLLNHAASHEPKARLYREESDE